MKKRAFLKSLPLVGLPAIVKFKNIEEALAHYIDLNPKKLAQEEDFWLKIREGYQLKEEYINLENGYYCHLPEETLENLISNIRYVNKEASYYMRKYQRDNKAKVTEALAKLMGTSAEEIAITRNTTESLDLIIGGYPWQEGDEAIMAEQDYGAMRNQFHMMEERKGIKVNVVSVPDHPKSDEEIVEVYAKAITPNTKLLMVCHIINITGHILPVKKICDMAHEKGVEVMVDGAHAVGHFEFKIPDLNCDYYGSSLHKWLSVPLGAGLLFIKKDKIHKIQPFFSDGKTDLNNIRHLNHTGTHPVHTDLTILDAINYYHTIGASRKEERLRYLQRYWSDQVRDYSGIIINTPSDPQRSCGIANVGVEKLKPSELAERLLEKYNIWTVAINGPVYGCRITPNIYTTTKELDQFVAALKEIADG